MPTDVPVHDPVNQRKVVPEPPVAVRMVEVPEQKLDGLAEAETGATGAWLMVAVTVDLGLLQPSPAICQS